MFMKQRTLLGRVDCQSMITPSRVYKVAFTFTDSFLSITNGRQSKQSCWERRAADLSNGKGLKVNLFSYTFNGKRHMKCFIPQSFRTVSWWLLYFI